MTDSTWESNLPISSTSLIRESNDPNFKFSGTSNLRNQNEHETFYIRNNLLRESIRFDYAALELTMYGFLSLLCRAAPNNPISRHSKIFGLRKMHNSKRRPHLHEIDPERYDDIYHSFITSLLDFGIQSQVSFYRRSLSPGKRCLDLI